ARVNDGLTGRIAFKVRGRGTQVVKVYWLLGPYHLGRGAARMRSPPSHSQTHICVFGWNIVRRRPMDYFAIVEIQSAELGAAQASCVCQNGLKHWLQFGRRRTDDLKDLRGRGLLLQRFREIVGALAQLIEQPRVLDGDDGLSGKILD